MSKKPTARLHKPQAILFILIFIALGTYIITRSFAAATVCNQTLAGGSNAATNNAALQSAVSGANTVTTICLGAGDYGTFNGAAKTNMVTVAAAPGLIPEQVTMKLSFNDATNLTIDGVKLTDGKPDNVDPGQPGQACTPSNVVPGGTCGTPGQAGQLISGNITGNSTKSVTLKNNIIVGMLSLNANFNNANILIDSNVFRDFNAYGCTCVEGRLNISATSQTAGITIQNNQFLRGRSDGIQLGANGVKIINNTFKDQVTGIGDGVHTDSIQMLGSRNTEVRGNTFLNGEVALMCSLPGDCSNELFENNLYKDYRAYSINLSSSNASNVVFRRNTFINNGTDYGLPPSDILFRVKTGVGNVFDSNIIGHIANRTDGGDQANAGSFAASVVTFSGNLYTKQTPGKYNSSANPTDFTTNSSLTFDVNQVCTSAACKNASGDVIKGYNLTTTSPPGPVVGELDASPPVNGHDLSLLLSKFNQTYAQYDLDNVAPITGHDLSLLLSNWGR